MSPHRQRIALVVLVTAFVASACGGPEGSRGVRVEDISTDVGLGIEVNLDAAPAPIVTAPIPRAEIIPPSQTLPPLETLPPAANSKCPPAGNFDFAELDAGVDPNPKVRPKEGSYSWKLDGKVITDEGELKVDEFETRQIKDVEDDSVGPDAFHFTVTQRRQFDVRPGQGTLESTYRVVPTGNARDVPNPPVGPNMADTGRGMYLVSTIFKGTDEEGQPTASRFEPTSPLLLLPFPVKDGEEIDTSGTDPQTGMQITITGQIKSKMQVDACGQRVDSWFVDATQTVRVTNPETLQTETFEANYDYSVAPQYGSMLLYERVQAPIEGPIVTVAARIAEVPTQYKVPD